MYENSRFLKKRFTFCGVNTNFGQQWAPPAYYHLTHIVSKGKHCSLIQKYMREGYMWMIRYIISYKLRQENKVVLWEVICS